MTTSRAGCCNTVGAIVLLAPSTWLPGSRLGSAAIEGGPTGDQVHQGVTAGLVIPVTNVRGLDSTLAATGSRDAMMPAGITAAATATAGLRLRLWPYGLKRQPHGSTSP